MPSCAAWGKTGSVHTIYTFISAGKVNPAKISAKTAGVCLGTWSLIDPFTYVASTSPSTYYVDVDDNVI